MKFNFDYTKCMMMKLAMAFPNKEGNGSDVVCTFEDALEIIKRVDAITLGMTKIIYLVGWQYNGHDDKYPDFFEVNSALKRDGETALESMLWLIDEAKKYHTVVSVHINFNDAYDNAPSFNRFVKNNALIRKRNGKPHPIERFNNRACYKTSFVEYYESGLFKEMFDRLLTVLPLVEQGTIHVDNFRCFKNYAPYISMKKMQAARRKMIEYVCSKGIDITTEYTYRESEFMSNNLPVSLLGKHSRLSPIDTLGLIPAAWWCSQLNRKDYVKIPPQQYCGGLYNEKRYGNFLYGNIHGEETFKKYSKDNSDWENEFIKDFATIQVPFQYLCKFKRVAIKGFGENERCEFENGVISYNTDQRITVGGITVKEQNDLLLPLSHLKDTYIAYSEKGCKRVWTLTENNNFKNAKIESYSNGEFAFICEKEVENNKIEININPQELLIVKFR